MSGPSNGIDTYISDWTRPPMRGDRVRVHHDGSTGVITWGPDFLGDKLYSVRLDEQFWVKVVSVDGQPYCPPQGISRPPWIGADGWLNTTILERHQFERVEPAAP